MKLASVEALARAFDLAGVRYLIVGGLAVNAHGYRRFTKDIDVVVQLLPDNVDRAFQALATLGYKPAVPVTKAQFADSQVRERLVHEKGMAVLQFWSDAHRETSVDVFASEPFPFEVEYERALRLDLTEHLAVRILALDALIQMKREAGRAQDLADLEQLGALREPDTHP